MLKSSASSLCGWLIVPFRAARFQRLISCVMACPSSLLNLLSLVMVASMRSLFYYRIRSHKDGVPVAFVVPESDTLPVRYIMLSAILWEKTMIPRISTRRICYDFHKLRCFSCCALLPLEISVDYQVVCPSCGQVHDCAPVGVVRSVGTPKYKTVSRLLPSGAVSRRRVPLSAADSQLDLFGGAL